MNSAEIYRDNIPETRTERLTDEELGNILAAFGNSEAKTLTLATMRTGEIYSANRLHRMLTSLQGPNPGWKTSSITPFKYCQESLAPIGLVAEEALNKDSSVYGYIRTPYGEKVGLPLAGLLLGFSERHPETSLYQLFGKTNSSTVAREVLTRDGEVVEYKERAPLLRLQIFRLLLAASGSSVKQVEITQKLNAGSARVKESLNELARNGLITYESVGPDKSYTYFRISEKILSAQEIPGKERSLSRAILEILGQRTDEELTSEEIARVLIWSNPKWKGLKEKKFRDRINAVMGAYTKQGAAEKGKYQKGTKSEITLDESKKALIEELVAQLGSFQNQDTNALVSGNKLAAEITSDPAKVSGLMQKAKENSRGFASAATEDTAKQILTILATNPESTNRQLIERLGQQFGRVISRKRVAQILTQIERSGKIQSETRHSTKYWSVKMI